MVGDQRGSDTFGRRRDLGAEGSAGATVIENGTDFCSAVQD